MIIRLFLLIAIRIFNLYCISSQSAFWHGYTSDDMLNIVENVEYNLRIFIYPIPEEANMILQQSKATDWDVLPHFKSEYIFRDHMKYLLNHKDNILNTSLNYVLVSDPSKANAFIIDHDWIKLSRKSCTNLFENYLPAIINNVVDNFPYYNRSNGYDHFFFAVYDKGPFCDPQCDKGKNKAILTRIINASFIGNYGMDKKSFENKEVMTNKDFVITTECHREGHDIVIPQLIKGQHILDFFYLYNYSMYPNRQHDSSFSGSAWGERKPLESMCDEKVNLSDDSVDDFECYLSGSTRDEYIYHGYFMYAPCGLACWSQRLYEALARYTIPILVTDGGIQAFEKFINWSKFTVKMSLQTWNDLTLRNEFRKKIRKESIIYRKLVHQCLQDNNIEITKTIDNVDLFKTKDNIWLISHSCNSYTKDTLIYKKSSHIRQVFEWLDFSDLTKPKNAYRLIELEMYCRIRNFHFVVIDNGSNNDSKFNYDTICNKPSDFTSRLEYFYDGNFNNMTR